jgi:hypothetical protein
MKFTVHFLEFFVLFSLFPFCGKHIVRKPAITLTSPTPSPSIAPGAYSLAAAKLPALK